MPGFVCSNLASLAPFPQRPQQLRPQPCTAFLLIPALCPLPPSAPPSLLTSSAQHSCLMHSGRRTHCLCGVPVGYGHAGPVLQRVPPARPTTVPHAVNILWPAVLRGTVPSLSTHTILPAHPVLCLRDPSASDSFSLARTFPPVRVTVVCTARLWLPPNFLFLLPLPSTC